MRVWFSLARLGGIALAVGLFASASATMASMATVYEVEPANVFAARGAQLEDEDEDGEPRRAPVSNDDAMRRKRAREAAVATILGHNPFCDDCPAPAVDAPPGTSPPPAVASAGAPAVQVLATMEALDPSHSLATLYDPQRGTWAASVGDALEPGVLVAAIGPGELTYSRGTATGVIRVGAAPEPKPTVSPKQEPRAPKTPATSDPMADRVNCDAGKRCTVERSLIKDVMANPSSLGGLRAFPSGGGFKIAGVRRGTLVHKLGLRNGDVLTGVGGKPLASIDDALSLLPLLNSASNIEVSLSRRGKPITHEIEIV
ncbi:MAG: hypothetical protein ACE37F_36335 [Nannocystaceae bacterium]|nr:hypothetical protein [bacterium]